jgi:hypothetical protein
MPVGLQVLLGLLGDVAGVTAVALAGDRVGHEAVEHQRLALRNGSMYAVFGSGIRSMSDSWISWNPRIDEPSKPCPSSKVDSSSSFETGMVTCCMMPGRSQKRKSTNSTAGMERQQDYVLRSVEERGVRLVRLWFTDVLGNLKSFAISPGRARERVRGGHAFDGSSIDGFSRVQESDVLALPDPNSFELLPWADTDAPAARMFCDIANLDGTPFEGDPRQVLKRNLDSARERGFTFFVAPEMEFFYFDNPTRRRPPSRSTTALLRPHHRRRGQQPPPAHDPHARGDGHPGGVLLPRGLAPASTRSTCATPTP